MERCTKPLPSYLSCDSIYLGVNLNASADEALRLVDTSEIEGVLSCSWHDWPDVVTSNVPLYALFGRGSSVEEDGNEDLPPHSMFADCSYARTSIHSRLCEGDTQELVGNSICHTSELSLVQG
ncbi:hypothetical protein CERSUDRAFT_111816 [Gelatoporia subvermispora B]|uniref:Uncharacterized protein n=1 Tax=Ceriporiopsis subvermispora (strain B) TaxID=914234 RepID=M2RM10_CERS8|nr:hypothetical protein CERSUDRAFT_111816 [Gelatoporia subvermispora B]